MKNLIPLRSNPNDILFDIRQYLHIYIYMLMGEQDFTIMSSKNQQAFDSKINKISEKKKYSWRQGLYNNKINLN